MRKFQLASLCVLPLFLAGCGIFGSDNSRAIPSDPDFVCTNSEPGTWSYLGIPGEMILSIAINPHNAGHILVGTSGSFSDGSQGKIFMSTDCGENWEQVWEGGNILEIHFNPKSPNEVFANPHGMIHSTDWGRSWSDRSNGLTEFLSFTSAVTTFAIDHEQPNRLYAGTQDLGGGLVFYTDNAGGNWQLIPAHQQEGPGVDLSKSAVLFIHTDPVNPGHVYVGNGPIMRSTDRGESWEMLRETDPNVIQTMAFSADHSKIFAMNTWRGFYEFNMPDGPWAFTPYPDSMVGTHISSIVDTDLVDGILLGTGRGVLLRKNNEYFSMVDNLPYTITSKLKLNGNNLYAAVRPQSSFISSESGIYIRRLNQP
ncbi:hypothetical protein CYPRO_2910 [Cyclonatronum proteinivorum]|uniref:Sortilin N-terminal domain-containing protein n=1 Tax=Cyclonatronum proteinivorum TaxID=1457365 RepID=A0A345UNU6_9BACT|nr:hypothetical protein [Cyclonatronum proteinivorum]AXJ02148.1 hypothetical protein CYPRO_2910 [Cyclonatronum proteinivorum]